MVAGTLSIDLLLFDWRAACPSPLTATEKPMAPAILILA